MSNEAFARSLAREGKAWTPFVHSFPFSANQTADRITIFGLYANSYLNSHAYLNEIEDEGLANLLADYNSKVAVLTAREQMVVSDIVSKRYLAGIDKLIHDQKLETKQLEIDQDEALWDAKIAALSSDTAALATMAARVSSETSKTEARIAELEAYISIEGMNLSQVDIDIAEKEIQSAKLDLEKLNIANEILRIQMQTVNAATELIDLDVQMARTKVNIAEVQRSIAKIGLLTDDLTIEQAKTSIEEAGIALADARIALAQAKHNDAAAEKTYIETTLVSQEAESLNNKTDLLSMRQTVRLNELERKGELQLLSNEKQRDASDLNKLMAGEDQTAQVNIDDIKVDGIEAKVPLAWARAYSAIRIAETAATANIATTLSHLVQKASS
jgi:chromosome segregation ATPase